MKLLCILLPIAYRRYRMHCPTDTIGGNWFVGIISTNIATVVYNGAI